MKTTTIELDQFRDRLDQALAEAEQGELILTRQGRPWIVMRAASGDRDTETPSKADRCSGSVSDSHGADGDSVSLLGKTVSWVRQYLGKTCTIPPEAMGFVDGKQVPEHYVLEEGQVLEFALEAEDEEWAAEMHRSPEFWEMLTQRRREKGIPWEEAKRQLDLD